MDTSTSSSSNNNNNNSNGQNQSIPIIIEKSNNNNNIDSISGIGKEKIGQVIEESSSLSSLSKEKQLKDGGNENEQGITTIINNNNNNNNDENSKDSTSTSTSTPTPTSNNPTENYMVKSTTILTEHLGYVPIALIDDIINAANEILYKCTAALDQFLGSRYPDGLLKLDKPRKKQKKNEKEPEKENEPEKEENEEEPEFEEEIDISQEIELGTAKFETLFESIIDKCFDKFELYLLRNLLIIPNELIKGGWIRLEHHKGIDFSKKKEQKQETQENNEEKDLNIQLIDLFNKLEFHKNLNHLLYIQNKRSELMINEVLEPLENECKNAFESITKNESSTTSDNNNNDNNNIKLIYKQIIPFPDTISFLGTQVNQLIESTIKIEKILKNKQQKDQKENKQQNNNNNIRFSINSKNLSHFDSNLFINLITKRAIKEAGFLSSSSSSSSSTSSSSTLSSSSSSTTDINYNKEKIQMAKSFLKKKI